MNYNDNFSKVGTSSHEPVQLSLFSSETEPASYLSGRGYAVVLAKKNEVVKQDFFRPDQLDQVCQLIGPETDLWISQAVFTTQSRRTVHVSHLDLNFVDLDYYKDFNANPWAQGKGDKALAAAVCFFCQELNIPVPSIIVHSGQGLQLKWLYDAPIPRRALPRWQALENRIVELFKMYGADPQVKDPSRVLRVVDSINTKVNRVVKVIWASMNDDGTIRRYNFESLCEVFLPYTREEIRERRERNSQGPTKATKKVSGTAKEFTFKTLYWGIVEDLRTLLRIRGGIKEGMREIFTMVMLNYLLLSRVIPPKDLFYEAAELAKEVDPRWNCRSESFRTLYKKACQYNKGETLRFGGREFPPLYTFKVATLLQLLDINAIEQREMKVLVSYGEKKRRLTEKRRSKGMMPRDEFRAAALARKERALALKDEGLSIRQIANEMKVSKAAVQKYLSKKKEVENLGVHLVSFNCMA